MSTLKFNRWQSIDGVTRNAVLQVVSKEVTTETSTTSTSFVDATDMFLVITPTSATSKIYVNMMVSAVASRSGSSVYHATRVLRDSTEVFAPYGEAAGPIFFSIGAATGAATSSSYYTQTPISFLDSPTTTNEITYKLQFCVYQSTSSGIVYICRGGITSTITLMEIAQ